MCSIGRSPVSWTPCSLFMTSCSAITTSRPTSTRYRRHFKSSSPSVLINSTYLVKSSKHRADLATVLLTMRQASLPILVISYFNQRRQLKSSSFWQDFDRLQDGSLQYANVDNPLYRICLEPAAQPGEVNRYIVYTG